jgi:hydroxypyruvate reductase
VIPIEQLREDAREIFTAGLRSVDGANVIKRHVTLADHQLKVGEQLYDLREVGRILVVGCGKAAASMAAALQDIFGAQISGGAVVVKYGHGVHLEKIRVIEAGHPIPDQAGVAAAHQINGIVRGATQNDLILLVVSGGGSALMPLPATGLSLEDKQRTTEILLASGATIHEVNALRKHLSQLKGGRFAELAYPATLIAFILSDVVGDNLDVIASGPTVPDESTYQDCLEIIERYQLSDKLPAAVVRALMSGVRGECVETPKSTNPIFHRVQNLIVGNNALALAAAQERAIALGYHARIISRSVHGESRVVAREYATLGKDMFLEKNSANRPACLIAGGETTVIVQGDGLGGRNQEFALAAALEIDAVEQIVILSAGTDGSDGPTDAAGAIVDGNSVRRGAANGMVARDFLARNDSYHFLQATDDLLKTGPTLTNVMDLQLILAG